MEEYFRPEILVGDQKQSNHKTQLVNSDFTRCLVHILMSSTLLGGY